MTVAGSRYRDIGGAATKELPEGGDFLQGHTDLHRVNVDTDPSDAYHVVALDHGFSMPLQSRLVKIC